MHVFPCLDMYTIQPKLRLPLCQIFYFSIIYYWVLLVLLSCLITAVHYFGLFECVVQQWDNKVGSRILWMGCTGHHLCPPMLTFDTVLVLEVIML